MMESTEKGQEFMTWAMKRLRPRFGKKVLRREKNLTDLLVKTVLSQNTNDLNRDRAFVKPQAKIPAL